MKGYLIGCDLGTGGAKAIVVDLKGKVLSSHFVEYQLIIPRPGWAEQDPEWYWKAAAETIKTSVQKAGIKPEDILAVGLSSLAPACILVDGDFKPLQNSHIWMDRRATSECEWLKKNIGERKVFKLTGNLIDPYYSIPKLMWEKSNRPELYKKARFTLNVKDYVVLRLINKAVTDYSHAALGGVAFDIRKRCWNKELLKEIGIDEKKLPPAYPCDEIVGKVTREASRFTGLKEGTPVVAGAVDANAACLSAGVVEEGENALTLGSTACWGMSHLSDQFIPGLICMPHIAYSKTHYISIAALVGGGSLLRWFRDNFAQIERLVEKELGIDAYEILNMEAEKIQPGSDGLLILPYFMGERCPLWDPRARGVIFGLSFLHSRAHIIRAIMEGVGFAIRHNINLLEQRGIKITPPMKLVEGGAKSNLWRQIIADVTGISTVYMGKTQGAPLGDAVMAGIGAGVFEKYEVIKEWLNPRTENETNPDTQVIYDELFKKYLRLYPTLKNLF